MNAKEAAEQVQLTHMFNPYLADGNPGRGTSVHFALSPTSQHPLCGLGELWKIIDGERVQIWIPTKRPVTCLGCTKSVEMVARRELRHLDAAQIEQVIALTTMLRAESK